MLAKPVFESIFEKLAFCGAQAKWCFLTAKLRPRSLKKRVKLTKSLFLLQLFLSKIPLFGALYRLFWEDKAGKRSFLGIKNNFLLENLKFIR